ncbi:MSHA biogenesis protein MshP [Shewanella profunda]|uniref:MSHA biogenesis protein MshP n=1 Tax=Shewanella profunda TaxID=254793 RepID=UPI00200F4CE1|nr:MSHA biogenesis protein MshP [Shewanella profunda]MCL1089007.1 MSHA biogenesis protein MshP [Shewanella profunda]
MFPNLFSASSASQSRWHSTGLPAHQGGSALIIGVFVITVMFLLASALINIVQDADTGLTQEVWGARALAAANSGADAALAQLFPLNGDVGVCLVNSSWTPPNVVGFHACSVTLTCTAYTADPITQYRINSKAVCESGDTRVSRQVEVEARG